MGPFDPEKILRVLAQHGVRFVLIGATAARLQGFPRMTADADITPATDPENLARLAAALNSKRAADRPQDRQDVLIIEQMLRPR